MLLDKSPHLRSPVLSTVKAFILKCVSTNSVRHSFAHKIILEYFNVLQNSSSSTNKSASSVENEKEKEGDERKNITEEGLFEDGEQPAKQVQDGKAVIGEIVPLCRDWLIQMAHTPNGAKVRRIFSVCAPPPPPVTEHVPLHSKSLCKNMARASGGCK